MQFGSLSLTPSAVVAGAAGLAAVGATLWWLVRKRQKRIWLPTIRIMRLESRILPRLVLRLPPVVAFLCFVLSALIVVGFALRPRTAVFTPFEPNQTRIHIFCDLSPSVSAFVSIDEYATRMAALYGSLKDAGRISVSTSASADVTEPENADAFAALIRATGFHRAGLHLGSAMKELLAERTDVDRLFIVSDRDQHSWTGFNWQYLTDEMDVVFYDLTGGKGTHELHNVFVNDARFLSSPSSPTMDWDVEVSRSGGGGGDLAGQLVVTYMGKSLGSFPWRLAASAQRVNVRAGWPATAVSEIDPSGARDVPLLFHVDVEGGDAIALDNEFRAELLGLKQDALVISEATGERPLEDPADQLEVALEILGFRLKRFDYVAQPGPAPEDFPFIALIGGAEGGVDRFCPRSLESARLAARETHARSGRSHPLPKVWLAPQSLSANYRDLCRCYARLLLSHSAADGEPAFCQHVESRSQWIGLLPSLGAKQVGGQVGEAARALAWRGVDQASGLEVVAFTVPLIPSPQTGINHAAMPILVKELLTWEGLLEGHGAGGAAGTGGWPRVDDIVTKVWKAPGTVEPAELARLRTTNVPLGASLLVEMEEPQLPPRWTSQLDWADKRMPAKKDREDPLPWLKLAAVLVVALSALEAVFGLGGRLARFVGRRPEGSAAAMLVLAAGLMVAAAPALGKVDISLIGYHDGPMTCSTLSREVAHRTSIDLANKPVQYPEVTPESLGEPWLWVRDLGAITGEGGALKPDVMLWLKRGGFLIIESTQAPAIFAKLTATLPPVDPQDGWQPLPPDHELMRSFYLLDALPSCNGEIWRGYHYDGRLAILTIPYPFLATLKDHGAPAACANAPDQERSIRVFVNLIMVALATDYKKDQIHLPEILKRLR